MTQLNKADLVRFLTEGFAVTFHNEQQRQALFDLMINMVNDDQENYWAAPRHPKGKIRRKKNQALQRKLHSLTSVDKDHLVDPTKMMLA